ncbi:HAD-IIA family hydrolase [Dermabacter sp. p3-SID358]|uniref:HAD-IIA family hydrolase n=1 Tax=Dermabacter sp. p3-SID358 TaxID=2916114 RepID=UPI0021A5AD87|nr:HAD-IIA family hydrolase [Dermabacter sp. p3-SID358]MCT1867657.1 HAD-IIA family hydrolase [Dermabacter sp. p3-SID358]
MKRPDPTFFDLFDSLLFDMDGTLMNGAIVIEHGIEAIAAARAKGLAIAFATNNASRTPDMVVEHLTSLGYEAHANEVVNSPMVAMSLVKEHVEPGSTILVVGGRGLVEEVERHGYVVTREDRADVKAVIQGFAPTVGWANLAEAAYAIRRGAFFVATNIDSTLPTEKGLAPGNGSLVHALEFSTGVKAVAAGKPEPAMFTVAADNAGSTRPLAIGDRLDTDLEGGNRANIPTFHTLTGVSSWIDAAHAPAIQRPVFVRPNLSFLAKSAAHPVVDGERAHLGGTSARLDSGDIVVTGDASSWRAAQVVMSLVNACFPEGAFEGEIRAESGELFAPFGE